MSTRCLTRIFDGDEELCCLYRHCDGYPSGHGAELVDFVRNKRIVNGFSSRSPLTRDQAMNGAGDLATKLIAAFVDDVKVYPVASKDCWEEYEYHVKCPTYLMCDASKDAGDYGGLPIVVEAFEIRGGHSGKPRTMERVAVPTDNAS